MAYMVSGAVIQQKVFSLPGRNMDRIAAHHIVKQITVDARRIHHIPALQHALVCLQPIIPIRILNMENLCLKPEFHTVDTGVFSQGDGHEKGADNTARRRI